MVWTRSHHYVCWKKNPIIPELPGGRRMEGDNEAKGLAEWRLCEEKKLKYLTSSYHARRISLTSLALYSSTSGNFQVQILLFPGPFSLWEEAWIFLRKLMKENLLGKFTVIFLWLFVTDFLSKFSRANLYCLKVENTSVFVFTISECICEEIIF